MTESAQLAGGQVDVPTCPLCGSGDARNHETISTRHLATMWAPYGVDLQREIPVDHVCAYRCGACALLYFDPAAAGGDAFYSVLATHEWYYAHPGKTEYDYIRAHVRAGDSVLDVGAGRGILAGYLHDTVQYTGLELSSHAVTQARAAGINVRWEDLRVHARKNGSRYDVVCLFQVLEHLTDVQDMIRAVYDCLRPGGKFCIAVPNNEAFIGRATNYTFNLPPHHSIHWTERTLRLLAQRHGFDVVDVYREPLQDVHQWVARHTALTAWFKRLVGHPIRLADDSSMQRKIDRICSSLVARTPIRHLVGTWFREELRDGQTIVVLLQKPPGAPTPAGCGDTLSVE